MSFADVIQSIPEIAQCLKKGLQALGGNSNKIEVNARHGDLTGSVDIDTCLDKADIRMPLVGITYLAIKIRVYYVEIHPADSTA